jgi:hypothetical protein
MKFTYYLDNSAGWAGVQFESGDTKLDYPVEYCLADNLRELLGGIIALSGYMNKYKIGHDVADIYDDNDDDFTYVWNISHGPASEKFIFKLLDDKINISIRILEYDENEKIVFDGVINFDELIDNILSSCSTILTRYGILGYYSNFWVEFPVQYYLMLKDYKKGTLKYEQVIFSINNRDENMYVTSIKEEIDYLLNTE